MLHKKLKLKLKRLQSLAKLIILEDDKEIDLWLIGHATREKRL